MWSLSTESPKQIKTIWIKRKTQYYKIFNSSQIDVWIQSNFIENCNVSLDSLVLKFLWKCKGPKLTKTKLSSKLKNKFGGFILLGSKTFYKAPVTETMGYWTKIKWQIDQWNKVWVWKRPTHIWIIINVKVYSTNL